MNEESFVDRREVEWKRLAALCDTADWSIKKLSDSELREFVRLYRRVSTDLAVARTKSTNVPLISFLNDLVGRAYGILYRSPQKRFLPTLMNTIAVSAQTVRRNRWFLLTSAIIFFGSALFIYGLMSWVPSVKEQVIPPAMQPLVDKWKEGSFDPRSSSEAGMMAAFYASNNPKTAIITGAVGAGSFGIVSVFFLFQNGAMLGALAHEVAPVGKLGFLLSSISPHGVPELSGAVVAGASGLLLGFALINPGRRRRADALKLVGKDAIVLLATSVVLMFIAAPIEGFFSFQPMIPQWFKVAVAGISVCGWAALWIFFGRTPGVDKHPLSND
jgi:uncharacterized membrane protein SpoIIM required for sporulation